jgi:hypothetical protein
LRIGFWQYVPFYDETAHAIYFPESFHHKIMQDEEDITAAVEEYADEMTKHWNEEAKYWAEQAKQCGGRSTLTIEDYVEDYAAMLLDDKVGEYEIRMILHELTHYADHIARIEEFVAETTGYYDDPEKTKFNMVKYKQSPAEQKSFLAEIKYLKSIGQNDTDIIFKMIMQYGGTDDFWKPIVESAIKTAQWTPQIGRKYKIKPGRYKHVKLNEGGKGWINLDSHVRADDSVTVTVLDNAWDYIDSENESQKAYVCAGIYEFVVPLDMFIDYGNETIRDWEKQWTKQSSSDIDFKVVWKVNTDAGQTIGNKQIVMKPTLEDFTKEILPRTRKGYYGDGTIEQQYQDMLKKEPNVAISFIDKGNGWQVTKIASVEDILIEIQNGIINRWAMMVNDFESPEANQWRETSDSESQPTKNRWHKRSSLRKRAEEYPQSFSGMYDYINGKYGMRVADYADMFMKLDFAVSWLDQEVHEVALNSWVRRQLEEMSQWLISQIGKECYQSLSNSWGYSGQIQEYEIFEILESEFGISVNDEYVVTHNSSLLDWSKREKQIDTEEERKIREWEKQWNKESSGKNDVIVVYRGSGSPNIEGKSGGVWVTEDEGFASEYGKVTKYEMPNNLNLLDATSNEANALANEFLGEDVDSESDSFATDIWYEPPVEFISFLKGKGYEGFVNEDNMLIFDKSKLSIPIVEGEMRKDSAFENQYWIDPSGKEYPLMPTQGHSGFVHDNIPLLKSQYGIDIMKYVQESSVEEDTNSGMISLLLKDGWVRIAGNGNMQVWDVQNSSTQDVLNEYIMKHKANEYIVEFFAPSQSFIRFTAKELAEQGIADTIAESLKFHNKYSIRRALRKRLKIAQSDMEIALVDKAVA